MLQINNRRYIGSKTKLLTHIKNEADNAMQQKNYSFADLFAGTGVVAYEFARNGHPTLVNDMLLSDVVPYKAWFGQEPIREDFIISQLNYFNNINPTEIQQNYFSNVYGDKYFSINDAKKIGFIRDYLQQNRSKYNEREFCILLTSLIYSTDKIANTVGHFEHYLSKTPQDTHFQLQNLLLEHTAPTQILNQDANIIAPKIDYDVVYLDPPYNARQYVNFYHVLENLARWQKPTEFEGKSMKFKRNNLKSGYSRAIAPKLFANLVNNLHCKVIIVSYNNTYNARSNASNNKIQEQEIIDILQLRGNVHRIAIDYKGFNAGKTDFKNHQEFLFVCKIK